MQTCVPAECCHGARRKHVGTSGPPLSHRAVTNELSLIIIERHKSEMVELPRQTLAKVETLDI